MNFFFERFFICNPMDRIKETELHIINFDKGTVWSKLRKQNIQSKNAYGYLVIKVYGVRKMLHRYIYEQYHNIELTPKQIINHINHNPLDNRIDNLNLVDIQRNVQYSKKPCNNKSGFKGVAWNDKLKKWHSRITVNRVDIHIKFCDTKEEAIELYNKKARELNENGFYYKIEGEEVILKEDNRHLINIEDFKNKIKGYGSVYKKKDKNIWISSLEYKRKTLYIGSFKTEKEAFQKLSIVLDYKKNNPDISVEDLKAFIKTIK